MEAKIFKGNNNLYIEVKGRIILEGCELIRTATIPLIDKGISQIYFDLSKVDFIDSAGLGVLVGLKMTANKNKARFIVVLPSTGVQEIMNVSKLDSVFDIIDGPDADLLRASLATEEYLIKTLEDDASTRVEKKEPAQQKPEVQQPALSSNSLSDKERVDQNCRNAVEFMRQGNYEKAIEQYLKALEIDPDYVPAHNNLAIIYEKRPAWHSKAIEQWQKVLELSQMNGDQKHIDRAQKHLSHFKSLYE